MSARITAVAGRTAAGTAVVVLVSALVVGSQVKTPAQRAASAAAPPASVITAEVERGTVTNGLSVRATLRPEHLTPVGYPGGRSENRAVLSGLPKRTGDVIRAGEVAAVVSGRPLIVLPGRVQGYRDLGFGARGPDVDQLRTALAGLGLRTGGDTAGQYGAGTATAVRQLYARVGFEAPRNPAASATGTATDDPELAARAATRAVQSAQRRADAAARAVAAAVEELTAARAAGDPARVRAAEAAHRAAVDAAAEAQAAVAAARDAEATAIAHVRRLAPGMYLPMAEIVYVPELPARVFAVGAVLGQPTTGEILRIGAGRIQAVGSLSREQASVVRVGATAQAQLADGSRLTGRVTAVKPADRAPADGAPADGAPADGAPATGGVPPAGGVPASGGAPPADGAPPAGGAPPPDGAPPATTTVVAEFGQDVPAAGVGQEIALRLTVSASPPDSLIVPVAAIYDDGGRSWVRLVTAASAIDVPVEVGVIADGRAAIVPSGPGLAAGERVVVGTARSRK